MALSKDEDWPPGALRAEDGRFREAGMRCSSVAQAGSLKGMSRRRVEETEKQ